MPILELDGKISQACLIQFVLLCRVLLLITKKTPAFMFVTLIQTCQVLERSVLQKEVSNMNVLIYFDT